MQTEEEIKMIDKQIKDEESEDPETYDDMPDNQQQTPEPEPAPAPEPPPSGDDQASEELARSMSRYFETLTEEVEYKREDY